MKAIGFWVDNGQIQYPLSPFTLSGQLKDIFGKILAIGSGLEEMSRIKGTSVLVDALTIKH
ncbi:peptidase PmbA [compost metagenome]